MSFQPDTCDTLARHFYAKKCLTGPALLIYNEDTLAPESVAMARAYKPKTHLDKLAYSPTVNPLMEPQDIRTKRRLVRSGRSEDLVNPATGEIAGVAAIHQVEERDDAEFVKVFAAGVAATYELTKTAQRVFQVVLDQYQRTPMSRGFADAVDLFWFGVGIEGRDVGMSEDTFKKGLRELLDKKFLHPKSPTSFWTNPALFFKGDRVMFIKEYRRRRSSADELARAELESLGQGRLAVDELQPVVLERVATADELEEERRRIREAAIKHRTW